MLKETYLKLEDSVIIYDLDFELKTYSIDDSIILSYSL